MIIIPTGLMLWYTLITGLGGTITFACNYKNDKCNILKGAIYGHTLIDWAVEWRLAKISIHTLYASSKISSHTLYASSKISNHMLYASSKISNHTLYAKSMISSHILYAKNMVISVQIWMTNSLFLINIID